MRVSPVTAADPSRRHLLGRLAVIELRVDAAVRRFRSTDPHPDDGFRGLYVSDEQVDVMLRDGPRSIGPQTPEPAELRARVEQEADAEEAGGVVLRLRRIMRNFDLPPLDVELLLVALAPDLDPRFERLYGYLHDDVTRRRASPGLALELAGASPLDGAARAQVAPGARLFSQGLLVLEDQHRPFLTRSLRVPDRVGGYLVGDDRPDPTLVAAVADVRPLEREPVEAVVAAIRADGRLVHLRQRIDHGAVEIAAAALERIGLGVLAVDARLADSDEERSDVALAALREARLQEAGLVLEGADEVPPATLRWLTAERWPLVLVSSQPLDLRWLGDLPLSLDVAPLTDREHGAAWSALLEGATGVSGGFRLGPRQARRAVAIARLNATARGQPLDDADLAAGVRAQNAAGLERLARRVVPSVGWPDMVLRADVLTQLHQLADRVRHRAMVLDEWGMRRGGARGEGITALFSGDSGTGKTMAAEVIAGDLGLDLYVIDLATVVDKYIGETEKNLDRIFSEAEGVNGVLFFDEADALFGNRSEVSDARDRYANIEVAYLLQRMETFDGLAVLATNLRGNLDEAFSRRLAVAVDFPKPEAAERRRLWDLLLGAVPRDRDIDLGFLARSFELCGGHIRNVAVTAAHLAAAEGCSVGMAHLVRGTQIEYRKLGRLCVEAEFGEWFHVLQAGR